MKRSLNKIFIIILSGLVILGIVYLYITFCGNPIVKYIAGQEAEKYLDLKYSQKYSVGKVGYNFKNKSYPIEIINANNQKNIGIHYHKGAIWDHMEEKALEDRLNNDLNNSLKLLNFEYEELLCSAHTSIAADQSFKSNEPVDRHDFAYITIGDKKEISKEQFAHMALNIIPVIKSVIIYGKGSEIEITYRFEKKNQFHYFSFKIKDSVADITKDYIVENTSLNTY